MTNDKLLLNEDKTEFPMTGTKQQLAKVNLDCKTVRIFAYSINREQSNKMSGMRLKTESETGRDAENFLSPLTPRFTDFFTDFEEKTDCVAV